MDIENDAKQFAAKVLEDSQKDPTDLILDQGRRNLEFEIKGKIVEFDRKARTLARYATILAIFGPLFALWPPSSLLSPKFLLVCGAIALIASAICLVRVFQTEQQIDQLKRVIEENSLP